MKHSMLVDLNRDQLNRLRDLVNDRQDELFDKLQLAVKENRSEARTDGLRDSLKFWDAIDVAIRDSKPATT